MNLMVPVGPLVSFTIELPFPPSVNAIWRQGRAGRGRVYVYLHPDYAKWKHQADLMMIMSGMPKVRIHGAFEVWIVLDETRRRGDADNRAKAVLDYLQRIELVDNDKHANDVHIGWGLAPSGCSVTVEAR